MTLAIPFLNASETASRTVQATHLWFDLFIHKNNYLANVFYTFLLLFIIVGLVLSAMKKLQLESNESSINKHFFHSSLFFSLLLGLFVVWGRLLTIGFGDGNIDEHQWISLANSLHGGMKWWAELDGCTGGPLVAALLIPLKWVGLPIDIGTTKIVSMVISALCVMLIYKGLCQLFRDSYSRIAILPYAVCLSINQEIDVVSYNTEHPALLALSISFWLVAKTIKNSVPIVKSSTKSTLYILLLGFALGTIPYGKLQAVPIAILLGIILLSWFLYKSLKSSAFYLLVGALTPTFLAATYILATHSFRSFWLSYIKANIYYANEIKPSSETFFVKVSHYLISFFEYFPKNSPFPLHMALWFLIGIGCIFLYGRKVFPTESTILIFIISLLWSVTAYYSITKPGTFFGHYYLFALQALAILGGTSICLILNYIQNNALSPTTSSAGFIFVGVQLLLFFTLVPFFNQFRIGNFPTTQLKATANLNPAQAFIMRNTQPTDKVAIWGWEPQLLSYTGRLCGTRAGITQNCYFESSPVKAWYLSKYYDELKKNKPVVLIDAVRPEAFVYNDSNKQGIKNQGFIYDYVQQNYNLVSCAAGYKFYLRKGRLII